MLGPSSVLVGRDREMDSLGVGLDRASAGQGSVWLIVGEPGVGKSRLVSHLARLARRRGFRVATGRCLEQQGAPVLWPWKQVLTGALAGYDHRERVSLLEPAAADLVSLLPHDMRLLPRDRRLLPGSGELGFQTQDLPPQQDRSSSGAFRLMEGLSGTLRRVAEQQATVVLLEDVHWADPSSLAALQFVSDFVEDAPLMILASFCPQATGSGPKADRLAVFLGKLLRAPSTTLLPLSGLDESAVQTLASHYVGTELAAATGSRIYRETDGNAFLVTELLRCGGPLTNPYDPAGRLHVPAAVSAVVETRFRNLSPTSVALLSMASVVGREFDHLLIANSGGLELEEVQSGLREAAALGLVEMVPPGVCRFTHGLLQQAIYQRLPWREQVDLHLRVAEALTPRVEGARTDWLPALAHHLAMAARGHPRLVGDAVATGLRVAEQAWAELARDDAVEALERTLRLVESLSAGSTGSVGQTGSPDLRPTVLLALGEAQHRAGLAASAMATFSAAAEDWQGDVEVLARASIGFEDACLASGRDRRSSGDPAVEMLEEALAALSPSQDGLRGRVEAHLARARWFSGDEHGARRLIDELVRRPADPADGETQLAVCLARRIIASPPDDAEERLAIAAQVAALASREGRYEIALDAVRTRVLTMVELGRLDDADDEIELFVRRLERWREPLFSPFGPIFRAMRALQRGRFQDAAAHLEHSSHLAQRTQSAIAGQLITMQRYALARWTAPETVHGFIPAFESFIGRTGSGTSWGYALLLLLGELGRWEEVTARLDRSDRNGNSKWIDTLPVHEFWSFSMGLLAPVLAVVGSAEEQAAAYRALLPRRSLLVGNVAPIIGSVEGRLGLLAEALGDCDTALGHLAAAARRADSLGTLPWLVEALDAQARVYRRRGMPGDDRAAVALHQRAARVARSICMVRATAAEPAWLGPGSGSVSVAALSVREREVLALLAAGRSNREIAGELFISYRTVKTHVSHILEKLGARDRTSAALLGQRAGL